MLYFQMQPACCETGWLVQCCGWHTFRHSYSCLLRANHTDVEVQLGDETLKIIARELVETVRRNTTFDWTCVRENVRAHLRVSL
jgi:hypothetical protein